MRLTYRPEINGLRTLAVGSVLIYHAEFTVMGTPLLRGGFLGVDVFFVISGFLITSLLLAEWSDTGRVSILSFYERRARRLLPALFVVIGASIPVAWAVLLPSQMVDFAKSVIASLLFVSNMYWYSAGQEYGAPSGLLEPFLHTWSLAVEEQFYILFPPILIAVLRYTRPALPWIGALVILGGLIVAEITTQLAPDLSFFWLISRIWELTAGAAVGCLLFFRARPARAYWHKAMPALGLILIVVPIWSMTQYFHHPGLGTVVCVLGTCLVLGFADPEEPVTRILSNRICVGIGLISYSLYLWHYPIFAFGRLTTLDPSVLQKLLWLALATGLSILSYWLVENPFRRRVGLRGLLVSFTTASAVIFVFCLSMLAQDGLRSRFPDLIALYGQNEFDNPVLQDVSWSVLADLAAEQGFGPSDASEPSVYEAEVNWFADAKAQTRVLVVGNSHGKDLFNALYLSRDSFPDYAFARFGMSPSLPQEQMQTLLQSPNFHNADKVLISFKYIRPTLRSLPDFLKTLQRSGKDIQLVLNTVEFDDRDRLPVFDWYLQTHRTLAVTEIETLAFSMRDTERVERTNSQLRHIAAQLGIPVLDRAPFICDAGNARCDVVTPEGYKAFYDYGHFTVEGARHFGRKIAQTGWLEN